MDRNKPKVGFSFLLIGALLIIIYLLQISISGFTDIFVLNINAMEGEFWRFFTAMFLHGSLSHLLSNLFALMLFGVILESLVGTRNFLVVYIAAGLLANIFSVFFYPSSLGASGAIYGIIGCITILRPTMMIWAFGVIVPMFIAALFWVAVDLFGVFVPDGVGHIAHLSGIVVGFFMGFILIRKKLFRRGKKSNKIKLDEAYMVEWERRFMK